MFTLNLSKVLGSTKFLIAHNIAFDKPIMECELLRNGFDNKLRNVDTICTMKKGINFCNLKDITEAINIQN